jgi:hypothetical protein
MVKAKVNNKKRKQQAERPATNNKPVITNKAKQEPKLVRTNSTIVTKLAKTTRAKPIMSQPYIMCRKNPFEGQGQTAIPDGGNRGFVVTDILSVDTVTLSAAGTWQYQTCPALPYLGLAAGSGSCNIIVNGVNLNSPTSNPVPNGTLGSTWYPMGVNSPVANGVRVDGPYSAVAGRAVQFGYRIYYVGPVNTCSGSITVTNNDVSFEFIGLTTAGTLNAAAPALTVATANTSQAQVGMISSGNPVYSMQFRATPSSFTRTSRTFRPEEGLLIVPKHKSNDFKIRDIMETPPVVCGNSKMTPGTSSYAMFPDNIYAVNNQTIGLQFFDNDWTAALITFAGCNADAAYRIETIACMEFNPNAASVFQPLTQTASPNNQAVMNLASQVTENIPMAQPLSAGRLE